MRKMMRTISARKNRKMASEQPQPRPAEGVLGREGRGLYGTGTRTDGRYPGDGAERYPPELPWLLLPELRLDEPWLPELWLECPPE
jgi:hypothetical protein